MSDPFERKIYEARLTPHRSMTPHAFYLFIMIFCFGQLLFALPFFFMGARFG